MVCQNSAAGMQVAHKSKRVGRARGVVGSWRRTRKRAMKRVAVPMTICCGWVCGWGGGGGAWMDG